MNEESHFMKVTDIKQFLPLQENLEIEKNDENENQDYKCSFDLKNLYRKINSDSSLPKKWIFQILWSLKSRSWMTGRDLNTLLMEREHKAHQKQQTLKIYDLNCYFYPFEIFCVLKNDLLFCINLSQNSKQAEPFDLSKLGIKHINFITYNPIIKGNLAIGTRESIFILQQRKTNEYKITDIIKAEGDSVYFSPMGKTVLVLNKLEYKIHVYNFLERKMMSERIAMMFDTIEFSPSGTFFALYSNQFNQIYLYETSTWNSQTFSFHSNIEMVAWDCYENFCNVLCSDNFIYRFKNYNNGSLASQTSKITHKSNDIISIERYLEGTHLVKSKFVFDEDLCGLLLLTYVSGTYEISFLSFKIDQFQQESNAWKGQSLSKIIEFPNEEDNEIREIFVSKSDSNRNTIQFFLMFSDMKLKRLDFQKPKN